MPGTARGQIGAFCLSAVPGTIGGQFEPFVRVGCTVGEEKDLYIENLISFYCNFNRCYFLIIENLQLFYQIEIYLLYNMVDIVKNTRR